MAAAQMVSQREGGFVGGAEALLFGAVVLGAGTIFMANTWAVVDAKVAVTSASREAARVLVESRSESVGRADAVAAAVRTMRSYGRDLDQDGVTLVVGRFGRCARVTVRVRYEVPAVAVPFWGGLDTVTVASNHSEVIDGYRSGLPGEANCNGAL